MNKFTARHKGHRSNDRVTFRYTTKTADGAGGWTNAWAARKSRVAANIIQVDATEFPEYGREAVLKFYWLTCEIVDGLLHSDTVVRGDGTEYKIKEIHNTDIVRRQMTLLLEILG